jgi:hypothetical protein
MAQYRAVRVLLAATIVKVRHPTLSSLLQPPSLSTSSVAVLSKMRWSSKTFPLLLVPCFMYSISPKYVWYGARLRPYSGHLWPLETLKMGARGGDLYTGILFEIFCGRLPPFRRATAARVSLGSHGRVQLDLLGQPELLRPMLCVACVLAIWLAHINHPFLRI